MKYNCKSTRKIKKKNFLGFILQDISPWNHKNVRTALFGDTLGAWEHQCGIQWFFMILWISESFSLYLLFKSSFNFKLGFSLILNIFQGVSSEKNILCSDCQNARWYWCKKDWKNLPQTSHKCFCECFIVNSSLLWAFMVENIC